MRKPTLALIVIGALLAQLPCAVAQYPLFVNFHLTATVQDPISQDFPRTFRETIVKIDNAKILELLGAATTNDFTGADLVVDHSGMGFSVVRGTNVLADVSSLLSRSGATGTFVLSGTQASDLDFDVNRKAVQQYRLMPTSAEHSFTIWAFENARIAWSTSGTGTQTNYSERATSQGFGDGQWDSRPAVFSGTIELCGPTKRRSSSNRGGTPGAGGRSSSDSGGR